MPKSPTRSTEPRLSELARHVILPSGVVSTGWPAVQAKCRDLGISFRPWQPGVGRVILAKRADGKYAATIGGTGLSIPRQVGKTFLVGAIVFALCLLFPNLTVIWTAHRIRTGEETFKKMQAFARRKKIAPYIERVVRGSGEEAIEFRNGSRILFGARESGFGRGFDEVDALIFDEAQILTENALDAMIPATNQSRQPTGALLLFMGTPPRPQDGDRGEVFTRMRDEALSAEDEDTGWVEFAGDEDHVPAALPAPLTDADWRQVAKANPSFPHDTPREAILRMRKKLGPDAFRREGLGIWDQKDAGDGALNVGRWRDLADPDAPRGETVVFGVDVAEDRTAWVAVAWEREDGGMQVQLVDGDPMPAHAVVERCAELAERWGGTFVPPRAFEADLTQDGVQVAKLSAADFPGACGDVFDAIEDGSLHHGNQKALNDAVKAVRWRNVGTTGERAWLLKDSPEIGPLVAATRAVYGLTHEGPSVYETRGPVSL